MAKKSRELKDEAVERILRDYGKTLRERTDKAYKMLTSRGCKIVKPPWLDDSKDPPAGGA